MFTGKLASQGCFLCGKRDDTLDVKMKDKSFQGVVCIEHLLQILKRQNSVEDQRSGREAKPQPK